MAEGDNIVQRAWVALAGLAFVTISTGTAGAINSYGGAIVLTKTVSSDGSCGTVDTIEVPAEPTSLTATRSATLRQRHVLLDAYSLVDDQLGTLFGPIKCSLFRSAARSGHRAGGDQRRHRERRDLDRAGRGPDAWTRRPPTRRP